MTPNDFGKKVTVEACQRISIADFLRQYKNKLKAMVLSSEIEIQNLNIKLSTSRTGFNGIRFWFECPLCSKRMGVLYQHPLNHRVGCRTCLNLSYAKQRYKGMAENIKGK